MNLILTQNLQMFIAVLLYLGFFSWVGWRRGTVRELAVFLISFFSWILLQNQGGVFRSIANLGGKFVVFARSGGLGEGGEDAFSALGSAPDVISSESQEIFIFILWVLIVVAVYVITNLYVKVAYADGWSIILGAANGLLFAAILLPKIIAPLVVDGVSSSGEFVSQTEWVAVLQGIRAILTTGLNSLWTLLEPQSSVVLLLLITLLLLLAATSLQRSRRTTGGSGENSNRKEVVSVANRTATSAGEE